MFEDFSLFPEAASTMAGRIDALYFFLVAIAVFFTTRSALARMLATSSVIAVTMTPAYTSTRVGEGSGLADSS